MAQSATTPSSARFRRVGVAWARVEPRRGEYDETELSELSLWVRAVRTKGDEPVVVLHDGAFPDWMISRHGWLHPDAIASFGCYVDRVAQKLGVHVRYWIPILGIIQEARWYEGAQKPAVRAMIEAHATAYLHLKRSQGFGGKSPLIGIWESDAGGLFSASPAAITRVLGTGKWSFPLGFLGELSNGTPALDFVVGDPGASVPNIQLD